MQKRRKAYTVIGTIAGALLSFLIFIIPFLFMFLESVKDKKESNALKFSLPTEWHFLDNYSQVIRNSNYQILRAFKNSAIITVGAVFLLIVICSLAGFFIQRRNDRLSKAISNYITIGLMVPPSIMPTIWIMQGLHLYKTMPGMILIEACLVIPFTTMLYRSFVATIPVELEEAAMIDGAGLKGYAVGGAMVSEKHCGFVINAGKATAKEVRTLMQEVSDKVFETFGVRLEPEVRMFGE